jgi:hypothetical protein
VARRAACRKAISQTSSGSSRINEQARGDSDAPADDIIAALEKAGYRIASEDTAVGSQPFDELTPDMRPQDIYG